MTARQSTFSFRFGAAALAAVAAFIAGCAVQPGIEGQAIDTESRPETKNLSALMEAGDRKQLTCTSMQPLSAQRALNDIVFSCPEFDVQATLIEMCIRDRHSVLRPQRRRSGDLPQLQTCTCQWF